MNDENLIQFTADAIMHYLHVHPSSAETLEGIHAWWIQWPDVDQSPLVTQSALEQLERNGTIERVRVGKKVIWRLPTERR